MSSIIGPPKTIIKDIYEIDPAVLEQLALWIEQRGIRTPLSNIVGYGPTTFKQYAFTGSPVTTTSASYVDLLSGGGLVGFPPGKYMIVLSCRMKVSAGTAYVSVAEAGTVPWANNNLGVLETDRTTYGFEATGYLTTLTAARTDLALRFKVDNAANTGSFHYGGFLISRLGG